MREPQRDKDRLKHILDMIDNLLEGRDNEFLDKDYHIVFYGFVKEVEIIGESVYMLSKEFKDTHTEVPWKSIEGMRHVLAHDYYRISEQQLWSVVDNDLKVLRPYIAQYIEELSKEE